MAEFLSNPHRVTVRSFPGLPQAEYVCVSPRNPHRGGGPLILRVLREAQTIHAWRRTRKGFPGYGVKRKQFTPDGVPAKSLRVTGQALDIYEKNIQYCSVLVIYYTINSIHHD